MKSIFLIGWIIIILLNLTCEIIIRYFFAIAEYYKCDERRLVYIQMGAQYVDPSDGHPSSG